MRWLAGAGLFVLVGCNQIFGLSATQAIDAGPDAPPTQRVTLDWQIGTIGPGSGSATTPTPLPPTNVPISPAPKVQVATMTGAFVDAEYNTADGTIKIPPGLTTDTWRLAYTLADGVHEVQWKPASGAGHLIVPIFGRPDPDRDPVPPGAGYTITPTNPPASYAGPRVFTTGLWTAGIVPPPAPPGAIDYDFASAVPLNGAMGAPAQAKGDAGLVIDYQVDPKTTCRLSTSYGVFDPTLSNPSHTAVTTTWVTPPSSSMALGAVDPIHISKIPGFINGGVAAASSTALIGYIPSLHMPGLTGPVSTASNHLLSTLLPAPVMVELLQCPYSTGGALPVAIPDPLSELVLIEHVQLVGTRSVGGAALASGMSTVAPISTTGTTAISFPAPLPTHIRLDPPGVMLDTLTEPNNVTASSGTFTFAFTPEASTPQTPVRGDYYDVVLHQIAGATVSTVRTYTILGLPDNAPAAELHVQIDGTLLVTGGVYVFEVRSYHGHPNAPTGDFSQIEYPYSETALFSRAISIQAP